jgi:taurine---2-oxoglutarate transaminase
VIASQSRRSADEIQALARRYVLHHASTQSTRRATLFTTGQGCYLWDGSGKRYLDYSSQLINCNLGYQQPKVVEALVEQTRRLCYIAPQQDNELAAPLAELNPEVMPGDLVKSFFTLGGSECIDVAVSFARMYTGRHNIISRYKSYHGATYGAGSVSGEPDRLPIGPGVAGIVHTLPQDCYRCPFGQHFPGCHVECVEQIEQVIQLEGPDQIAAVVAEPLVTGLDQRSPDYYPRLRQICDKHGILLVADEIVTGFGRTGKWFGSDHFGVVPDIVLTAKGLNSGYAAVGAVTVSQKIADYFDDHPIGLVFTSGGHPSGFAACIAVIETIKSEGLVENARRLGDIFQSELPKLQEQHRCVGNAHGRGMLWMLDLVKNRESKDPLGDATRSNRRVKGGPIDQIRQFMLEKGLIVQPRGSNLRITPPLIATEAQVYEGLAIVDDALTFGDSLVD